MDKEKFKHTDVTEKIIKAYYAVYNQLGYGFLEKVYENAMAIELRKMNLPAEVQRSIRVYYDNEEVGFYVADLVVSNCVIVELKATESLCEDHEAQLTNYLRATDVEVGLLFNFGKKPEFKRKAFSNDFKDRILLNQEDPENLRSN